MSTIEEHCKECEEKLGKTYKEVHEYLDQFFKETPEFYHREHLHNKEGVEEIRKKFGDEAVKAAEIHIMADYRIRYIPTKNEVKNILQAWTETP